MDERIACSGINPDWIAADAVYNATPQDSIMPFLEDYTRAISGIRLNLPASDCGRNFGLSTPARYGKNRFKLTDFLHTTHPRGLSAPASSVRNVPTFRFVPIKPSLKPTAYLIRTVLLNLLMKNNMASKAIKFLEEHQSDTPSRFAEEAAWRKENAGWLRWSRQLVVTLIGYIQDNGLKRADLAARLGVSPQYVSKLLSGTENLSFKSVANIEDKLGISCLAMA